MVENQQAQRYRLLRVVNANLYHFITNIFYDKQNLHSYDIQILTVKDKTGYHIRICFGENFNHIEEIYVNEKDAEARDQNFKEFLEETADQCREIMVKEYFKMMKP